ncbi:hypothetical protein CCAX7_33470 [Capsulimonas corticalis]|uniref:Putative zinc-finger domain-containing protein n=1 Tax=Capsulimonas corticalis TaxID=2219043 RepID=A0A402CYL1_9BACT|nr:zf-HC2 domain-containing protein [Capsulimonas corticalis]BDI31296.1 hypothetical protein CCAX7_33470 [Capsulimonas corticalis]
MSNQCENLRPMILEHSDGRLSPKLRERVESHLSDCAACQAFARDMRLIARGVASLPSKQTTPDFDARLAARLAEAQRAAAAKPAWRRAMESIFATPSQALKPGLALCGAAAALGGAAFFAPHPAKPISATHTVIDENAMLAQCIEQHRSESSAQPLDDWSAQPLTQQLDKAPSASPGAVSLAEESNL